MKNVSKKQMITLVVLIAVLILVIAVQYFYRPVLVEKEELSEKVESMNMVYDDMKMLAAFYSVDSVTYKEQKELLAKKRSEFLPFMKNSQQDDMITKLLVSSRLSVESSEISDDNYETVQINCSIVKDEEDTVDAYSVLAMYPLGAKIVAKDDSSVVLEYETGECSREIYYNVSGRYGDIIDFLQKVYDQKSMEVSQFYFNSGDLNAVEIIQEEVTEEVQEYDEETGEYITKLQNYVRENSVQGDTIYKAGIGIRVHMYDRSFDLKSRTD